MFPKVTIIIPTFNRANDLHRCLTSVKKQTYTDYEVIVCDDGSTDNTLEIVEKFKEILNLKYYWFENFGGPARGRNLGIQKSKGEYIAFLDSDDWWTPDKLATSVGYLNNGVDLVYHDLILYGLKGIPVIFNKAKTRNLTTPVMKDLLLNGNGINNSSVVVRKSILVKVGFLSEDKEIIAGEDFDYWIQISKVTDKYFRIPKSLGYYWIGGNNISDPIKMMKILSWLKRKYKNEFFSLLNDGVYPYWVYYLELTNLIKLKSISLKEIFILTKKSPFFIRIKMLLFYCGFYLKNRIFEELFIWKK